MVDKIQKRFDGKIALVTGAARGIGRGIALALAAEGADIVLNDFEAVGDLQKTADEIRQMGREIFLCPADVADRASVARLFSQAVAHFGQLDIVVANAGFSIRAPILELEWKDVQKTIDVVQFGVFHTCQMAAQQMVQQGNSGKILIIGSVLEELAIPTSAPYNMAKAAINHLARTMAAELAQYHINVNVINPGWIDTPGERRYATDQEIAAGAKRIPWQRLGTPADIGKAATFLVSEDADYITGTSLRVDGGYVVGMRLPEVVD